MAKLELTKSIEARRLNPRTKVPTNEYQTIPFGGIIENLVEQGDVLQFAYLGEFFQYPKDDLKVASRPIAPVS